MESAFSDAASPSSPLESFLREYLDKTGGIWEEVEPQVYDMVLPAGTELPGRGGESGVVRLTFDPEALPEHPTAQLASFGTPLVDRLLSDAVMRGRGGQFYLVVQNLPPHDLLNRLKRSLHVAPATIQVERMRALHFPQVVFWFQAAFVSDQKEQIILPVAIDLHHGREVRHLEQLLDPARLAEQPASPFPPARVSSLNSGFRLARGQLLRTLASLANNRGRELHERCDIQVKRLERYYADLRTELDEQKRRARNVEEAAARHAERLAALEREESAWRKACQKKHSARRSAVATNAADRATQVVGAGLADSRRSRFGTAGSSMGSLAGNGASGKPPSCPNCGKPSYQFTLSRSGKIGCASCKAGMTGGRAAKR